MIKKTFRISLAILLATLLVSTAPSHADRVKTIAVLPFKINAAQDLSFLGEGITDMLYSRLTWKGKVKVVEKGLVKEKAAGLTDSLNTEAALSLGKALKADYVILGSLTVFGQSVSIDAKILDVNQAKELMTAFNQSQGMDEVIPTINQFAQDINAKILGRYVRPPAYAAAPEQERPREISFGEKVSHAQSFKTFIVGIDAGDVDGDGGNELVAIDTNTVYIYKWIDDRFAEFRTIKGKWVPEYVYLSVADVDKNGKAEIYVSNLYASGVSSSVLEWRSGELATVIEKQPWFLRVIELPGKGETLIGQRRETNGGFSHGIYILQREGETLARGEPLALPSRANANIFNFIQGNITDRDTIQTAVLSPRIEHLYLFAPGGKELWKSLDRFGGTNTHIVVEKSPEGPPEEEWIVLGPPLLLTDMDNNGLKEVVVCKNESPSAAGLLARTRVFSGGKLLFLSWDGLDLVPKWETKRLTRAITGYCLKDVDNDGRPEVGVSVVVRSGALPGTSARSQVMLFDID